MGEPLMLPEVVSAEVQDDVVDLNLRIPAELKYFDGHFDQAALLPGVVQIDWAVYFGRQYFPGLGDFSGMEVVKFKEVIAPNQQVTLSLTFKPEKMKLHFSYTSSKGACSSGRIVLNLIQSERSNAEV